MKVFVIGAGGHAKVVIATLKAAGRDVAGVFDDDQKRYGTDVLGVPVCGTVADAALIEGEVVAAIGNNATRRMVVEKVGENARWATVVHPHSWVHESVTLGVGTVVFAGAIVQPETVIGRHVIVNTAATVDHDGWLGDFVHLAPGVHLAGGVTLGDGAFLGVGAGVIPGQTVGAWTTVGAGGVVVRDLPPHVTAVGVPAVSRER